MADSPTPLQNYLIRGTDPAGAKQLERIQATSAQHAMDQLTQRGFTQIELETDDFVRSLQWAGGADETEIKPQTLIRLKEMSWLTFQFFLAWTVYRTLLIPVLVLVGVFLLRRIFHLPLNYWDFLLGALFFSPLAILLLGSNENGKLRRRMEIEFVQGDFETVIKLADQLAAKEQAEVPPKPPGVHSIQFRARALARMGKTAEAIHLVERLRDNSEVKPAQFQLIKATVYDCADQPQKVYECYKTATEIEPQNPMGWLGMIDPLAMYLDRPAEARQHLEHVRTLPLSSMLKDGTKYCEAIILLAEGKYPEARTLFEAYLPILNGFTRIAPTACGMRAMLLAQLALCCVRTGDMKLARRHFKIAEPFLTVHRIEPLLSRCKRELEIEIS